MKRFIERINFLPEGKNRKRFWHFCYSWGAAVVLIGAMFKILHFPYANTILMFAMTVEALIFIVSAFDTEPLSSIPEKHPGTTVLSGVTDSPDKLEEKVEQLSRQVNRLSSGMSTLRNSSEEIEKQTFNYALQIRQMERNLQELNELYGELASSLNKPETGIVEAEDENDILN